LVKLSQLVFDATEVDKEIDLLSRLVKRLRLDELPGSTFYPWCKAKDPEEYFFRVLHLPMEHRYSCQDVESSFILNAIRESRSAL
jgi:hypothetical protein